MQRIQRIRYIQQLTKRLILMTAAALLVFVVIFAVTYFFSERLLMTWAGFVCGIIGGFVSIQQRLNKIDDEELELLAQSWFQILLVPIFGGVFALVLYCIFLSGLVYGNLFPRFNFPPMPAAGPDNQFMQDLLTKTYPSSGEDFAKFLFWSFVAGFSERLVPQIINQVAGAKTPGEPDADQANTNQPNKSQPSENSVKSDRQV